MEDGGVVGNSLFYIHRYESWENADGFQATDMQLGRFCWRVYVEKQCVEKEVLWENKASVWFLRF